LVKIRCQICNNIEATLQQIGSSGNYYRCKHYSGMANGKPKFFYHQQTKTYAEQELSLKGVKLCSKKTRSIDIVKSAIEPINAELRSKCELEPSAGFGPATITLPR
jgi:hypothetical protein